jgi:cellulose synthase/poly-beta-1,6-N-acetylglucosamine synthase-like glycosyltransferase
VNPFLPLLLLSAAVPLYVYAGYPILLWTIGSIRGRRPIAAAPIEPDVTLIVSAYNEQEVIGEKLENSLSLDYPRERLEVIVVSDCSSDRTDAIVAARSADGVRLVRLSERMGKSAGLNQAVATARGSVLVFSDANAFYRPDAIRNLVANFADPQVGCVTGESRYSKPDRSTTSTQENLYWRYERWIKILESAWGSMVGSDGAILALRRGLFEPLRATDLNDLVIPLRVVARGYRVVYEPSAICDEAGMLEYAEEFRRKVRIVNRSVFALRQFPSLFNPLRAGTFALQLISHKALRWSVGLALVVLLICSAATAAIDPRWAPLVWAQCAFYALAAAAALFPGLRRRAGPVATLPYYFCLVNVAALIGGARGLLGRVQVRWNPERRHGDGGPPPMPDGRRSA